MILTFQRSNPASSLLLLPHANKLVGVNVIAMSLYTLAG